jgi:hypothetical protein
MTLFVCLNCPLTGTDLGEWNSDHPYFKNILQVHESHKGFQEDLTEKKKIQKQKETDLINNDFFRMLHLVIYSYKGSTKCCLLKERLK